MSLRTEDCEAGGGSCGGASLVRSWACRPCSERWPAPGPAAPGAAASSASPAPRARSPAWPTPAAGSHFQTGAEKQTLDVDKNTEMQAEMSTYMAEKSLGGCKFKIQCF